MLATARSLLHTPLVAFAALIHALRRIPGYRALESRVSLVVLVLVGTALVLLVIWMAQRSPQRVTMADLVDGDVSSMQSWIIVSGDLAAEDAINNTQRYVLTDPNVENARMVVTSDVPLTEGRTTISGQLLGGNRGASGDFLWLGQMRADPVLAREPDPPWAAIGIAAVALFVGLGSKTTYPMFVREPAGAAAAGATSVPVGVRREWPPLSSEPVAGALAISPGAPVSVNLPGQAQQVLRLHSARSSAEVGDLRRIGESVPALLVRSSGELTLTFASDRERDTALAALIADAQRNR